MLSFPYHHNDTPIKGHNVNTSSALTTSLRKLATSLEAEASVDGQTYQWTGAMATVLLVSAEEAETEHDIEGTYFELALVGSVDNYSYWVSEDGLDELASDEMNYRRYI